jgi:tRNA (guanine10-N2)-methyltransferase
MNSNGQSEYKERSFCFRVDTFNHGRSKEEQKSIIESFSYLGFDGQIRLKDPAEVFVVHELWSYETSRKLLRIYLGRYVKPFAKSYV